MTNDDLQFYPTPASLAKRAWGKFKEKSFTRVLEPSAGDGALANGCPRDYYSSRRAAIDCIELDIAKHPLLREEGLNVIGVDFLKFKGGSVYSHIILNPPFAEGAKHVLHAWDILEDGEIVAILNAETVRNPFSRERQLLLSLIERHGECELIQDAFNGPDAVRKTDVEIALVWLKKESAMDRELLGDILDNLKKDQQEPEFAYEEAQSLALPSSFIENLVTAFKAAVEATRQSVIAEARANYYCRILGQTYAVVRGEEGAKGDKLQSSKEWVRSELGKRYDDIKDRAWTGILNSTQVQGKLSSAAQRRLETEFKQIKSLDFTCENIYGFLLGLVEKQGEIQIGMACDVFDEIVRYHSEGNGVWYMGWKSNDKHRTCGMRIKTTRFVIPGHKGAFRDSLNWDSEKQLSDFDKVFAMVDGKQAPDYGLVQAFRDHFKALRDGERVQTSYFDVRYYPGRGTIHFFPRDQKLVDRFNRLVGRHRQWLPPEGAKVSEAFWLQYQDAEKFDTAFRAEVAKSKTSRWGDPYWKVRHGDEREREEARNTLVTSMQTVLERRGINPDALLEQNASPQLMLLAA